MRTILKRLVFVSAMILFPLQSLMAGSMPLCAKKSNTSQGEAHDPQHAAHSHDAKTAHKKVSTNPCPPGSKCHNCKHCDSCHLSAFPALMVAPVLASPLPSARVPDTKFAILVHVPELSVPPPLSLPA